MIKIKETKSVKMYYRENDNSIRLQLYGGYEGKVMLYNVDIPMSKIFQVKRGLESATQRFYRYGKKKK